MKHLFFLSALSFITLFTACAAKTEAGIGKNSGNSAENDRIKTAVRAFSQNADKQNVEGMTSILHKDFRAIVNRLFGSTEVSLMDKEAYLGLLKAGKIGGDDRTVSISEMTVIENNASVKVVLTGKELKFETIMQLVKDASGNWKVISDMPYISKI